MKLGLLLTATVEIAVRGGHFSNEERMEMYTSTLRFYRDTFGRKYPILVVENSNADLSPWLEEFKDSLRLEVIRFRPDDPLASEGFDPSKGKGFNEYLMIKKGLAKSELVRNGEMTHILKITGRYAMINVLDIAREVERRLARPGMVFLGDVKDTKLYELVGHDTLSSHWGDSRFWAAEIGFYRRELADCYKFMNDYEEGHWAEHYFLNLSRKYRKDKRFLFRFRTQVRFDGFSGTVTSEEMRAGKGAQNTAATRRRAAVRQLIRRLLPWLWI